MKIRVVKDVDDNVFNVNIFTEDFSQADLDLMENFGEPEIDLGGSFTGPPAFTLPNDLQRLKSDSPHVQSFDARDELTPGDAEVQANDWSSDIVQLIKDEMTTLRANVDGFSGETVETF
jgi:hypothetical protein